jgi:NADH dehydrogenase/NADH:ubiquinone oxidoreductase subunit G
MLFFDSNFEWSFFFKQIDTKKKSRSKILIIINDELSLESLIIIKDLAHSSRGSIKVRSISNQDFENKTYDNYFKSKISVIEKPSRFFFLLSTNIRLESAILNVKIRAKYLAKNTSIISLGLNFSSSLTTEYINLNASEILAFIEGKSTKLSKILIAFKNPIFLFGPSFKNRFAKSSKLISHLKNFMPTSLFFVLEENCNSSGVSLINVKSFSNKDLQKSEILISINLKEIFFVKAIKPSKVIESFWFNFCISEIALKYDMVLPANNHYETGGTFLNLESRPQKSMRLDTNSQSLRSIKSVFKAIKNEALNSAFFLRYTKEIAQNARYFNYLENKFTQFCNKLDHNLVMKIDSYPSKASIEDYYTKDSSCKKSLTMTRKSQETRSFFTNFL